MKGLHFTRELSIGILMLLFNSIAKVAVKLNYWQGKDSLKEKSYLTDEGRQKPEPQRKMNLIEKFLVTMRLKALVNEDTLLRTHCCP